MSFSKIMGFLSVLSHDSEVWTAVEHGLPSHHKAALAGSWSRLGTLLRERPATGIVLDSHVAPEGGTYEAGVIDIAARFPSVWLVLVARPGMDPGTLFRLGRVGIRSLALTHLDELRPGVGSAVRKAFRWSTEALVTRAVSPYLPARQTGAVRLAMRGGPLGWTAEQLADAAGLSRAHLSVLLKSVGLPSTGHLLGWAKLLHAARWLSDPGRSGESVSRQLDYSSGAAFRRALRHYVGSTPMEVRTGGGLQPVLDSFMETCGIGPPGVPDLSVA